ncbi:MAG: TraB/GumN family protein [Pseudomonadales bacterium]|nr:TraB/GumN family protein [Pseudomonadales bacterium]
MFDTSTSVLSMPCVAAADDSSTTYYSLELSLQGDTLVLLGAEETPPRPSCTASFNSISNELLDSVRVGDDQYRLLLRLGEDNQFSVLETENLGLGPTSLWRVSDGTNHLFLGGTVHALESSDFPLPSSYDAAYTQSVSLITEVGIPTEIEILSAQSLYFDPSQQSLEQRLSEDVYNSLSDFVEAENGHLANVEFWRTNLAMNDLTGFYLSNRGIIAGVESHFENLATIDEKSVIALETYEFQLQTLGQQDSHLTDDEIVTRTLESLESGSALFGLRELIEAWRYGDLELLEQEVLDAMILENEQDYNSLLKDRNLDWIPQIEAYLSSPEVELVLVGVLHMPGEDGLLELLEGLGYSVERYVN